MFSDNLTLLERWNVGHIAAALCSLIPTNEAQVNRWIEYRIDVMIKRERKNVSSTPDSNVVLSELERTMIASIALMKRLRREHRRTGRADSARPSEQ